MLTSDENISERLVFGLRMTGGISLEDTGVLACSGLIRKVDELIEDDLWNATANWSG